MSYSSIISSPNCSSSPTARVSRIPRDNPVTTTSTTTTTSTRGPYDDPDDLLVMMAEPQVQVPRPRMISDQYDQNSVEADAAVVHYTEELVTLRMNSKPIINVLTMMAEDYIRYSPRIVQTIEAQLDRVKPDMKLPILYLIDSIIKNVKKDYIVLFTQNIVSTFCAVFDKVMRMSNKKVDAKVRSQMFKLRLTWSTEKIFPFDKLQGLDIRCNQMDSGWPIAQPPREVIRVQPAPVSSHSSAPNVHVNPKFLKQLNINHSSPSISSPSSSTSSTSTAVLSTATASISSSSSSSGSSGGPMTEAQMREQLLLKQQELLDLQRKKLELEILQTQAKLEEEQKATRLREEAEFAKNKAQREAEEQKMKRLNELAEKHRKETSRKEKEDRSSSKSSSKKEESGSLKKTSSSTSLSSTTSTSGSPSKRKRKERDDEDESINKNKSSKPAKSHQKHDYDSLFEEKSPEKRHKRREESTISQAQVWTANAKVKDEEKKAGSTSLSVPSNSPRKSTPQPVEASSSKDSKDSSSKEDLTESQTHMTRSRSSNSGSSSSSSRKRKERPHEDRGKGSQEKDHEKIKSSSKSPEKRTRRTRTDEDQDSSHSHSHTTTSTSSSSRDKKPLKYTRSSTTTTTEDPDLDYKKKKDSNAKNLEPLQPPPSPPSFVDSSNNSFSNSEDSYQVQPSQQSNSELKGFLSDTDLRFGTQNSGSTISTTSTSTSDQNSQGQGQGQGRGDTDLRQCDLVYDPSIVQQMSNQIQKNIQQIINNSNSTSGPIITSSMSIASSVPFPIVSSTINSPWATPPSFIVDQSGPTMGPSGPNPFEEALGIGFQQQQLQQQVILPPQQQQQMIMNIVPPQQQQNLFLEPSLIQQNVDPMIPPIINEDILRNAERDVPSVIPLDRIPRDVKFYGETAIVMVNPKRPDGSLDDEEEFPREISFQKSKAPKVLVINNKIRVTLQVGFGSKQYFKLQAAGGWGKANLIDHHVKIVAPTRELCIDGDKYFRVDFGGPPIEIELNGRMHLFELESPPPQVVIGNVDRFDLVAGRIELLINSIGFGQRRQKIYLDDKPQLVDLFGYPIILQFINNFCAVTINSKPFKVNFGGPPIEIVTWSCKPFHFYPNQNPSNQARKHLLHFSRLPQNHEKAMTEFIRVKCGGGRTFQPQWRNNKYIGKPGRGRGGFNNHQHQQHMRPSIPQHQQQNQNQNQNQPQHHRPSGIDNNNTWQMPVHQQELQQQQQQIATQNQKQIEPAPVQFNETSTSDFKWPVDFMMPDFGIEDLKKILASVEQIQPNQLQVAGSSSSVESSIGALDKQIKTENNGDEKKEGKDSLLGPWVPAVVVPPSVQAIKNEEEDQEDEDETSTSFKTDKSAGLVLPDIEFEHVKKFKEENVKPLVDGLYAEPQCDACGLRFSNYHPEGRGEVQSYANHLDWHYKANRREKMSAIWGQQKKHFQSREWLYSLKDWSLIFEEESNTFVSSDKKSGKPMEYTTTNMNNSLEAAAVSERGGGAGGGGGPRRGGRGGRGGRGRGGRGRGRGNNNTSAREKLEMEEFLKANEPLEPINHTLLASDHKLDNKYCPHCREEFETTFDRDLDEWRINNAVYKEYAQADDEYDEDESMIEQDQVESSKLDENGEKKPLKKIFHPICYEELEKRQKKLALEAERAELERIKREQEAVEAERQKQIQLKKDQEEQEELKKLQLEEEQRLAKEKEEEEDEVVILKEGKKEVVIMSIDVEDDEDVQNISIVDEDAEKADSQKTEPDTSNSQNNNNQNIDSQSQSQSTIAMMEVDSSTNTTTTQNQLKDKDPMSSSCKSPNINVSTPPQSQSTGQNQSEEIPTTSSEILIPGLSSEPEKLQDNDNENEDSNHIFILEEESNINPQSQSQNIENIFRFALHSPTAATVVGDTTDESSKITYEPMKFDFPPPDIFNVVIKIEPNSDDENENEGGEKPKKSDTSRISVFDEFKPSTPSEVEILELDDLDTVNSNSQNQNLMEIDGDSLALVGKPGSRVPFFEIEPTPVVSPSTQNQNETKTDTETETLPTTSVVVATSTGNTGTAGTKSIKINMGPIAIDSSGEGGLMFINRKTKPKLYANRHKLITRPTKELGKEESGICSIV